MKLFIFALVATLLATGCIETTNRTDVTMDTGFVKGDDTLGIIKADDTAKRTTIQWLDTATKILEITDEKEVEIAFRFKNTGTKPLSINNVMASCGCTSTQKPAKPIAPGEESYIKAVFDPRGRLGINQKTVTVVSNTDPQDTQLHFVATVTKKK